jgi:hypothetical protein
MAYFLDNGLELPTDPELLDKLASGESIDWEDKPAEGVSEDKTEDPVSNDKESKTETVDEPKGTEAKEPGGVAAQDGKHVLPFSVLQNTRARANALESKLAEMTAEIERLKTGKESEESTEVLTDEELAALEDEGPVFAKLAKTIRMQQEQLAKLIETTTAVTQATQQDEKARVADTVQSAIDTNESLAKWQSATEDDPDGAARWAHALEVDQTLRGLPAWKEKPMAERFAEVQRRVQMDFGDEITTQPDRQKSGPTPNPKSAATNSKKGSPDGAPETLSDMPGGTAPDDAVNLDALDSSQLAKQMEKMSWEQIQMLLAKTP